MEWFSREEADGREERPGGEERLGRADRSLLRICLLAGIGALVLGFFLYPRVNPEASIRFEVDRSEARARATSFLHGTGLDPSGYRHAVRFTWDAEAKVFLERTLGMPAANGALSDSVRIWRWSHRWFRPLQKEELRVEIAVDGSVVSFDHPIEESAPGAGLTPDSARGLAERFLAGELGVDPARLEFEGSVTVARPARTDHAFTWKTAPPGWGGGELRHEVRIQGNQVGGYRRFVHVPEAWSRDYARLRSYNETAGVVAQGLTMLLFIALLVTLLLRMRRRDIRWKPAMAFGLAGIGLQLLAELNALPLVFHDYATTDSLGGFLGQKLTGALLSSLLLGMLIFLLTAAGESLYRERYPGKLALTSWFTVRAWRTRRFLLSAVLGLAMTAGFFCYQQLFYLVAARFGAWAPIEVPYDDLLGTAFPWVFVLLIGFMPAVSEEFLFRLFPIPWLQRGLRSRALAIVIPALIWGFAHSNYPNQPFFIRGLEVGLAGIAVGAIMLRWNIFATLVWHYTVDALYTGALLFRSGNAYYAVSAALAGGVILFPLVYAIVSYRRAGRFVPPGGLRNADRAPAGAGLAAAGGGSEAGEPGAPALSSDRLAARADAGSQGAAGPLSGLDGSGLSSHPAEPWDEPAPPAAPEGRPEAAPAWSWRRRGAAAAIGAGSLLLLLLPGDAADPSRAISIERAPARERSAEFARAMGENPESLRSVTLPGVERDEAMARYLREQGGPAAVQARFDGPAPPLRWKTRFFRPLDTGEFRVEVDAVLGNVVRFDRVRAERDTLPSLDPATAEALARSFLATRGPGAGALELREASEERRPRRTDRLFRFEVAADDIRNSGEARHRERVEIQGDRVSAWRSELKLPEEWLRHYQRRTLTTVIAQVFPFLAFGAVAGLLLWRLLAAHRAQRIPWRAVLLGASPLGALALAGGINGWPALADRYPTAMPWEVYSVTGVVGIVLGAVVNYLLFVLCLAAACAAWPGGGRWLAPSALRRHLPDALLGGAAFVAAVTGLRRLSEFVAERWDAAAVHRWPGFPAGSGDAWPWLGLVWEVVRGTVLVGAAGAALVAALQAGRNRRRAAGVVALLVVAIALPDARAPLELLLRLGLGCLWAAALLALVRFLPGGNHLVWPLAVYLVLAVSEVGAAFLPAAPAFRQAGVAAALVLMLPVAWLVLKAFRSARVRP